MHSRLIGTCRSVLLAFVLLPMGCSSLHRPPATLYQVSTLQALMQGAYDGVVTFGELRRHGDTGIGTFQSLDGEMVMVDGRAYQVRSDGKVLPVPDRQTTPFATVAFFQPGEPVDVARQAGMASLADTLDRHLPTRNIFYLVRIDGRFSYVKTRSVPAQTQPYKPLAEAARQQAVFERHDVEGTLVALRCPECAQGINLAGWHMHFLSKDRTFGGHILDVRSEQGLARIAPLREFEMVLPSKGRFVEADLARSTAEDIKKVEQ